jgi:hypothetical protein
MHVIYIYRSRAYTGGISTSVDAWEFGGPFQEFIFTTDTLNTIYDHESTLAILYYLDFKYTYSNLFGIEFQQILMLTSKNWRVTKLHIRVRTAANCN